MSIVIEKFPVLLGALPMTFYILGLSVGIALVLGILLTVGKLSKHRAIRAICSVYISFMRGTPMVAQLLIIFIGIPVFCREGLGISTSGWNNAIYAILAFSLNEAAFFAEIFRSAYLAIDKGQMEAGMSLGMTGSQLFLRIILPQAAGYALPNTMNMTIELMKNTSLGMAIGVVDLLGMAKQVSYNAMGVGQTPIFLTCAVMYWVIGLILMAIANAVTAYLNRCDNPNTAVRKRTVRKENAS